MHHKAQLYVLVAVMGQWGSCLSARTGLASSLLGQLRREGQRASPGSSRGQRCREDAAAVEHRH